VGADGRQHRVYTVEDAVEGRFVQHVGAHCLQTGTGRVDRSRVAGQSHDVVAVVEGLGNEGPARGASTPKDREVHEGPPTRYGW
jgi:hypothetical protein